MSSSMLYKYLDKQLLGLLFVKTYFKVGILTKGELPHFWVLHSFHRLQSVTTN